MGRDVHDCDVRSAHEALVIRVQDALPWLFRLVLTCRDMQHMID